MAVTLQHEKPELEVKKSELLKKEEDMRLQLVSLEEVMLQKLSNAQGNILEDKVSTLNEYLKLKGIFTFGYEA